MIQQNSGDPVVVSYLIVGGSVIDMNKHTIIALQKEDQSVHCFIRYDLPELDKVCNVSTSNDLQIPVTSSVISILVFAFNSVNFSSVKYF